MQEASEKMRKGRGRAERKRMKQQRNPNDRSELREREEQEKAEREEGACRVEALTGTPHRTPQSFPGNGGFLSRSGRQIVKKGRLAFSLPGHRGGCSRPGAASYLRQEDRGHKEDKKSQELVILDSTCYEKWKYVPGSEQAVKMTRQSKTAHPGQPPPRLEEI